MSRYLRTGLLPNRNISGLYGDFTTITTFQDAQNRVIDAQNSFMNLPSEIRKKFRNNPHELIKFMENPNNEAEAEKLGLLPQLIKQAEPEAEPKPDPEPTVPIE